jgi:hypothetical protein
MLSLKDLMFLAGREGDIWDYSISQMERWGKSDEQDSFYRYALGHVIFKSSSEK